MINIFDKIIESGKSEVNLNEFIKDELEKSPKVVRCESCWDLGASWRLVKDRVQAPVCDKCWNNY